MTVLRSWPRQGKLAKPSQLSQQRVKQKICVNNKNLCTVCPLIPTLISLSIQLDLYKANHEYCNHRNFRTRKISNSGVCKLSYAINVRTRAGMTYRYIDILSIFWKISIINISYDKSIKLNRYFDISNSEQLRLVTSGRARSGPLRHVAVRRESRSDQPGLSGLTLALSCSLSLHVVACWCGWRLVRSRVTTKTNLELQYCQ